MKKVLAFFVSTAIILSALITGFVMVSAIDPEVVGVIENFESYADDTALRAAWENHGDDSGMSGPMSASTWSMEATGENTDSGKAMKINLASTSTWGWINIGKSGAVTVPSGAQRLSLWIKSTAAVDMVIGVQYNNTDKKYLTVTPSAKRYEIDLPDGGIEFIRLNFGYDSGCSSPETACILYVDTVTFVKDAAAGSFVDKGTDLNSPGNLVIIDAFENRAESDFGGSQSDTPRKAWHKQNGDNIPHTIDLHTEADGKSMHITAAASAWGWLNLGLEPTGGIAIPADAKALTFWVKNVGRAGWINIQIGGADSKSFQCGVEIAADYEGFVTIPFERLLNAATEDLTDSGWTSASFIAFGFAFTVDGEDVLYPTDLYIDTLAFVTSPTVPGNENSEEPKGPTGPTNPTSSENSTDNVKTGIASNLALAVLVFVLAASAVIVLSKKRQSSAN